MSYPENTGIAVKTFQKGGLAKLLNSYAAISTFNKKFLNFENTSANLGSAISFNRPSRMMASNGLVWNIQGVNQLQQTLTVNQSCNVAYAMTAEDLIFTYDKTGDSYLPEFAEAAIAEIGAKIEGDILRNAISGVINANNKSPGYGTPNVNSGPYRFFGDGRTPINSSQQLAQMIANFKDFGAVREGIKVYLPEVEVPPIIGTNANQFAPRRNDRELDSWVIGEFGTPPVMYYQSNLLPIHYSGTTGNEQQTLTLVSTNDATGANITQLTFSGASASDTLAVKSGDLFQFQDGVSGKTNVRFRTYIGHETCQQPVQFRATANAASDGSGNVTISITPALCWVSSQIQNLNVPLSPGMQVLGLPDHRAGFVVGGDAAFLAMPRLPSQPPFISNNEYDPDSGASIRCAFGAKLGEDITAYGHDALWDSTACEDYCMRMIYPL